MPKKFDEADKRPKRWRPKCPQKVSERIVRAKKEEYAIIKQGTVSKDHSCYIKLTGSNGNVYDVTIGQIPTCTCPDFHKHNDVCKHTLFVLLKIVGVDADDELLYQKAFTINELKMMFEGMTENAALRYFSEQNSSDVDAMVKDFATTNIEEGGYSYANLRGITGQPLHRDKSTYRPYRYELPPYKRWR
jgi:hypothetical protein